MSFIGSVNFINLDATPPFVIEKVCPDLNLIQRIKTVSDCSPDIDFPKEIIDIKCIRFLKVFRDLCVVTIAAAVKTLKPVNKLLTLVV